MFAKLVGIWPNNHLLVNQDDLAVCLRCGRSLASRVSHLLNAGSTRELRIYNVIQEWSMPRTVEITSSIWHNYCWVAADRAAIHMVSGPPTSSRGSFGANIQPQALPDLCTEPPNEEVRNNQSEPTIVLPDYMRTIETEKRCFIEGCQRSERYIVPLSTRKMLLSRYKYYIPENNRLCVRHLVIEAWDFLDSLANNYVQTFTAKHIQDMMSLKEVVETGLLHFERIDDMEDHVVHTWNGLNKVQFHQMFNEVPQLLKIPQAPLALAAYLMKLRSGDSNVRLSTLLKVSRRTLEKWLHRVRELLTEYFVPRYLGPNHLSRQQIYKIQENSTMFLGLTLDAKLQWGPHISKLANNLSSAAYEQRHTLRFRKLLYVLKTLRNSASNKIIKTVYVSLCQSLFSYCISAWGGATKTHMLKLERTQRMLLKVGWQLPFLYPTTELYKTCQVLSVRQTYIMHTTLKAHHRMEFIPSMSHTSLSHKRRRNKICPIISCNTSFAQRFFLFKSNYIYNKANAILDIYSLCHYQCKQAIIEWLKKMDYENTEKFIAIIS